MKFCAVICEYDPFHNGHAYQLREMKKLSGADAALCLMSGNFTQRGEAAIADKYTRARHAVENGADAVLELPAAFATAPAELFARGAVHILASLPCVTTLAFGCESGDKESFLAAARASLAEDKAFKAALKENMKDGESYLRARIKTVLALNGDVDESLFSSPNNLLGTEYCRALLAEKCAAEPLPIPRVGAGYADVALGKNFSSATALRAVLRSDPDRKAKRALRRNLPPSVFADLDVRPIPYGQAALCALLRADEETIAATPDCSEGLENKLKSLARSNPDYDGLVRKVVSKRYTLSRVKRILMQNFLEITLKEVRAFAEAPLYVRTLAVRKERAEDILASLAQGKFPLVVRKSDALALKKEAAACFGMDMRANDLYCALTGVHRGEYETVFVD